LKDVFFAAALHAAAKNTLSPGDVEKLFCAVGLRPPHKILKGESHFVCILHSHVTFVCLVVS
jgi:hypothetical protein